MEVTALLPLQCGQISDSDLPVRDQTQGQIPPGMIHVEETQSGMLEAGAVLISDPKKEQMLEVLGTTWMTKLSIVVDSVCVQRPVRILQPLPARVLI